MCPFSITIDGKTTVFEDSFELWKWCAENKPEWCELPESEYTSTPSKESYKSFEDKYDMEGVYA